MKWLVPLAALCTVSLGAAGAEDPATVEAEVNKSAAALREQLKSSVAKVDAAITAAAKEGGLKPSTQAYFRDCLSHFQTSPAGLSEADRIYFPPRFDSTPAIEPINLAFADLRTLVTRQQREQDALCTRLAQEAGEALTAAARHAERAADFAPVLKLIAQLESFADPGRVRRSSVTDPDPKEQVRLLTAAAQAMGEVLEARAAHDELRLTGAYTKLGIGANSTRTSHLPAVADAESIFRARIIQPYRDGATALQAKLEDALMARRPSAEIEPLLTAYRAAIQQLHNVLGSYGSETQQSTQLLSAYQRAAEALMALADHDLSQNSSFSVMGYQDTPFVHAVSFRAFQLRLARDLRELEHEPRSAPPRKETAADTAAKAAAAKVREDVSAKIDAVQTAEATSAVIQQVGALIQPNVGNENPFSHQIQEELLELDRRLRQLATAWTEGTLSLETERNLVDDEINGSFGGPMLRLADRALRDVIARRQHLPEFKERPAAALPVAEALQTVADAAAEKGEWKKALTLLELLPASRGSREGAGFEQIQAIRSYLTGLNFEQAEQYAEAVASYQIVLATVSDHVPLADATAKLKKLRADHPDAFSLRPALQDLRFFSR